MDRETAEYCEKHWGCEVNRRCATTAAAVQFAVSMQLTAQSVDVDDVWFEEIVERWMHEGQRWIDGQVEAGARFIVSHSASLVHTIDCPSVRIDLDYRAAFAFAEGLPIAELRELVARGFYPYPPQLVTAEHLNEISGYERCQLCSSEARRRKQVTRAGTAHRKHIGRRIDGRAVTWVRLDLTTVTLGLDDGSTLTYGLEDRIVFDRSRVGAADPGGGTRANVSDASGRDASGSAEGSATYTHSRYCEQNLQMLYALRNAVQDGDRDRALQLA